MTDPVRIKSTSNIFERHEIVEFVNKNGCDPFLFDGY